MKPRDIAVVTLAVEQVPDAQAELRKVLTLRQEALRRAVTRRQEAMLILMGYLAR